jgi:hypothetical protein
MLVVFNAASFVVALRTLKKEWRSLSASPEAEQGFPPQGKSETDGR